MAKKSRLGLGLFAVLAALSLVLAACGEDEPVDTGGDTDTTAAGEDETTFTTIEEGVLTVGSDIPYPPFEFEDEGGTLTGFDVEIVRGISERLGLENPDDAWISTDFTTIFQQLASNTKFDVVVAAVTGYADPGTPAEETVNDRRKLVDFSVPMYDSLQSLTVDAAASPDIKSVADLPDGAKIAVQRGTTGAFFAEEELAPAGAELISFAKAPQMYQALLAGQVVGVFNDLPVSIEAVANQENLEVVEQIPTGEQYAIAVSKDNPELLAAIDGALEEMFQDGTYAEIFEKYFPEQELPPYASM